MPLREKTRGVATYSREQRQTASANKVGEVVSVHVIARPHDELEALIGALGNGGAD